MLVDTGFISKRFAERAGLRYQADSGSDLQCANGSELRTYGHLRVTLKIQAYASAVLLTVADVASSDIILGGDWLVQNPGVIDTPRKLIKLVCGR